MLVNCSFTAPNDYNFETFYVKQILCGLYVVGICMYDMLYNHIV